MGEVFLARDVRLKREVALKILPDPWSHDEDRLARFQREAELLGISVDSIESHRQWLNRPVASGGLGPLRFALASDPQGHAAKAFCTWVEEKEVSSRGLFIIDPEAVLQYADRFIAAAYTADSIAIDPAERLAACGGASAQ